MIPKTTHANPEAVPLLGGASLPSLQVLPQGRPCLRNPLAPRIPYLPGAARRPLAPGPRQDHRALPLPKPKEQPSSAADAEIRASAWSQNQPALPGG